MSVAKTGRVVIVEESPQRNGIGAEMAEEMMDHLTSPIKPVAAQNTPARFAPPMEEYYVPSVARITDAVRAVTAY